MDRLIKVAQDSSIINAMADAIARAGGGGSPTPDQLRQAREQYYAHRAMIEGQLLTAQHADKPRQVVHMDQRQK